MNYLADRINRLSEPQTIKMAKLSRELKSQGIDIIDLSLGEPDFATPQHIVDAAKAALDAGYTKYTPVAGILELREAISRKFKRENNLDYGTDQIVVSTGAKHAIINTVLSLVNPNEEVLIPTPYWVSYSEMVRLSQGVVKFIPASIDTDFKISAAQLEAAITPKTKLVIYSSPCNPTGSFYTYEELKAFAAVIVKYPHVHVISDEIYEHINFSGVHQSLAQFPEIYNQVITVNGVSKGYSMTGWRIGYIGAPKHIAAAVEKIQSQFTSGTNHIAQRAAIAALDGTQQPTKDMVVAFKNRRDLVLNLLKEIEGIKINHPMGAFYVFPDVSSYFGKSDGEKVIKNADDFCDYLMYKGHVSLVTGDAFGDSNCVRISYATSEDKLTEAMKRIKIAVSHLK